MWFGWSPTLCDVRSRKNLLSSATAWPTLGLPERLWISTLGAEMSCRLSKSNH